MLLEIDCRWSPERCQAHLPALSSEIQERAGRYLVFSSRRNLIATRTRIAEVLRALDIDPAVLAVAENGRPYLRDQSLQFNLSHSHERAVLALSRDRHLLEGLGVDLEWMSRAVDVVAIGRRFFTSEEHAWVGSSQERFFRTWTRKEAVLKSNGVGLRVALDSFEVLQDTVPDHVTGRALRLDTVARENDYLISWATSSPTAAVHLLTDEAPDWCRQLSELL